MAIQFLPILLLGGAAVYVVTQKKKPAKKSKITPGKPPHSVKVIDKGTYSYTSNCQKFLIGGADIASYNTKNLSPSRKAVLRAFEAELMKATKAEHLSHAGDTKFDDRPLWMWEFAVGVAERLAPECNVKEGKPLSKVASAIIGLTFVELAKYYASIGSDPAEVIVELVYSIIPVAKHLQDIGAKDIEDPKFDLIGFIKKVRKNPEKYELNEEEMKKFDSQGGADAFFSSWKII